MTHRPLILITGATHGIGRIAAIDLARRGADLILTARSREKADDTAAAIRAAAPGANVESVIVDFADLGAVVAAGRAIAARHERIDALINNAGIHAFEQRIAKDGFAEMITVNYFAPWLLTAALRETMVRSAPSRIITTASEASRQGRGLDVHDALFDTTPFSGLGSSRWYGFTKLLDIMFSLELARQLRGTGVAVNCLCPGFNNTGLGRELGFASVLGRVLRFLRIGNPQNGADLIVRVATDPRFLAQSGCYVKGRDAHPITPVAPADSDVERGELWTLTSQILSRFYSAYHDVRGGEDDQADEAIREVETALRQWLDRG